MFCNSWVINWQKQQCFQMFGFAPNLKRVCECFGFLKNKYSIFWSLCLMSKFTACWKIYKIEKKFIFQGLKNSINIISNVWTSKLLRQLSPFKDLNVWLLIGKTFENIKVSGVYRIESLVKPRFYFNQKSWNNSLSTFLYFLFQSQMESNSSK